VIDPALVQDLVRARREQDPFDVLGAREREVLALMAEGRSNAGIARQIWIAEATVENTCTASSANSTSPAAPTTTAGSRPCSPTSAPPEADQASVQGDEHSTRSLAVAR
jgi:hypothetical protein